MSETRTFSGIKELSVIPPDAAFLLISNPSLIPHISLGVKEIVHSLTVNGYSRKSVNDLLPALERKKIPCLIVILDLQLSEENVSKEFSKYAAVDTSLSCLVPVRDSLTETCSDLKDAGLIYKLLGLLEENRLIKEILAFNMNETVSKGVFTFSDYKADDVRASINELLTKKKEAANV